MGNTAYPNPEVLESESNERPPESESNGSDDDMKTDSYKDMETSVATFSENVDNDHIPAPPAADFVSDDGPSASSMDTKSEYLNEVSASNHDEDGYTLRKREMDVLPLPGVKRPRLTVDEKQPSVHVIYNSLSRESVQKLRELLQQWSQWHSQKCPSDDGSAVLVESGEETYFPALRVGLDKPCEVTFWVDYQFKTDSSNDFVALDGSSVPLYDRGYSSALASGDVSGSSERGIQDLDSSRCFNCGSYSHSLKDCPRPRDNTAVNNARKEHKSKRNQNPNSRNATRYYQSPRRGKYDDLRPGSLNADTKKALGLGEFDPPPWLNRMREIGYPPGYLDHDEEDLPSGITIFGDGTVVKVEADEEGEISDGVPPDHPPSSSKKKMVEFPGINGPIPDEADQRLWAPSSSGHKRAAARSRYENSSESGHSRPRPSWHRPPPIDDLYHRRSSTTEPRWDMRYDNPADHRRHYYAEPPDHLLLPPGCEPGMSPSLSSPRFSRYDDDRYYYHHNGEGSWTGSSSSRSWPDRDGRNSNNWPHSHW